MNEEKISVIIPTYNRGEGLAFSIESVLHQSYPNIEIIVVDDNKANSLARENVLRIMERYSQYENIKYILHSDNRGASAARNTGVKIASGSLIAFLDDDDQFMENYLKQLYDRMIECKSQMVFLGNYYKFDGEYTFVKKRNYKKKIYSFDDILNNVCQISIFFLIRKDFFLQLGMFDETLRGYEDLDMWINVSSKTEISVVDTPLAICNRDGGIRTTTNIAQLQTGLETLRKKWCGESTDINQEKLERFFDSQKIELENQERNMSLFSENRITFASLCRILCGEFPRAQKVRSILIFLFRDRGQRIYRWLQFKVFNSEIVFYEVSNER